MILSLLSQSSCGTLAQNLNSPHSHFIHVLRFFKSQVLSSQNQHFLQLQSEVGALNHGST